MNDACDQSGLEDLDVFGFLDFSVFSSVGSPLVGFRPLAVLAASCLPAVSTSISWIKIVKFCFGRSVVACGIWWPRAVSLIPHLPHFAAAVNRPRQVLILLADSLVSR